MQRTPVEVRPVRLPLQVGLAGLGQTTRYAALVWLGPGLLVAAAMFAPAFSLPLRALWIVGVGLTGIAAVVFAVDAADNAKRDRPSDILLGATGLEVKGGAEGGRTLAWSEVDAGNCQIAGEEPRVAVRWLVLSWLTLRRVPGIVRRVNVPVTRLRLPLRAGGQLLLAEGEGSERASLQALRDSIRSVAAPAVAVSAPVLPPGILCCERCGAAQVPVDAEAVACPYCGSNVPMPAALREKQRAVTELHADDTVSSTLVARLISQPGAENAGRSLWFGRKLLVLSQPAALVYLVAVLYRQTAAHSDANHLFVGRVSPNDDLVALYDLGVLALALSILFVGVWSVLSAYFEGRRALRVLAENFGAVPPAKPGAPFECRQCGAPLPSVNEEVVVRCVYCRAENVLDVDPRPAAARSRTDLHDIQTALRQRRRARTRLALALPLCVALGAFSLREVALTWWVPGLAPDTPWCSGHCGKLENHDAARRSVSFSDGEQTVRATVLPHAAIAWDCSACSLELGGRRIATDALPTGSSLVIADGTLQAPPGVAP